MNDREIEQRDQVAELLQRADAVAADRVGDGAEDAERRQPDDEADDPEQDLGRELDQVRDRLAALAGQAQRGAEQHGEHQHLQDVALGEGADEGRRDDVHRKSTAPWISSARSA